jgi:hypothetical protein
MRTFVHKTTKMDRREYGEGRRRCSPTNWALVEADSMNSVLQDDNKDDDTSASENIQGFKSEWRQSCGGERYSGSAVSRDAFSMPSVLLGSDQDPTSALALDLDQPWQRSLLRELENTDTIHKRPFRSDRMMLGHANSGDFALPVDDDFSVETDTSSTIPTRGQVIHRVLPSHEKESFCSEEDNHVEGTICHEGKKTQTLCGSSIPSPRTLQEEHDMSSYHWADTPIDPEEYSGEWHCTPMHPPYAFQNANTTEVSLRPTPKKGPVGRRGSTHDLHYLQRVSAFGDEPQPFQPRWVGLEDDVLTVETSQNEANCMCWGTGILDFLLPPRQNGAPFRGRKRRTYVSPRPQLSVVNEVVEDIMETASKASISRMREEPTGTYRDDQFFYGGICR